MRIFRWSSSRVVRCSHCRSRRISAGGWLRTGGTARGVRGWGAGCRRGSWRYSGPRVPGEFCRSGVRFGAGTLPAAASSAGCRCSKGTGAGGGRRLTTTGGPAVKANRQAVNTESTGKLSPPLRSWCVRLTEPRPSFAARANARSQCGRGGRRRCGGGLGWYRRRRSVSRFLRVCLRAVDRRRGRRPPCH